MSLFCEYLRPTKRYHCLRMDLSYTVYRCNEFNTTQVTIKMVKAVQIGLKGVRIKCSTTVTRQSALSIVLGLGPG